MEERLAKIETHIETINRELTDLNDKMNLIIAKQYDIIKCTVISLLIIVGAMLGVKIMLP